MKKKQQQQQQAPQQQAPQMNPGEALQLLDSCVAQVPLNREQANQVRSAINVLVGLVNAAAVPPKDPRKKVTPKTKTKDKVTKPVKKEKPPKP